MLCAQWKKRRWWTCLGNLTGTGAGLGCISIAWLCMGTALGATFWASWGLPTTPGLPMPPPLATLPPLMPPLPPSSLESPLYPLSLGPSCILPSERSDPAPKTLRSGQWQECVSCGPPLSSLRKRDGDDDPSLLARLRHELFTRKTETTFNRLISANRGGTYPWARGLHPCPCRRGR